MGRKVLIIADSPAMLEMLRSIFTLRGFDVLVAATGDEGIEIAACRSIDAAIAPRP